MLQYPDLSYNDIHYYWGNSVVMLETKGVFTACYISSINDNVKFPITLTSVISEQKVISLRLQAFIRRVLVHHPALGYGDYQGVPLYLSPAAGANLRKGVDRSNLSALCPINWKTAVAKRLKLVADKAQALISSGRTTLPAEVSRSHRDLRSLYQSMNNISSRGRRIDGIIHIHKRAVIAKLLEQSVNNIYPPLASALDIIKRSNNIHGISISRDFALLRTSHDTSNTCTVYHRMTPVGTINVNTSNFMPSATLSTPAQACVTTIFNQLQEK